MQLSVFAVPKNVKLPALLISHNSETVEEKTTLSAMVRRGEARWLEKSWTVRVRWSAGQVEKRTIKVAQLKTVAQAARGAAAKMSPPNPKESGNVSPRCFYYNLLDGLAEDVGGRFGETIRRILRAWKTPRNAA